MSKIKSLEQLSIVINGLKDQGKKVILCHGCFDLMHPGHIKYFQAAKKMGDMLVVTVTQDIYVDKGLGRPVFNETLRAECVAALECVDYVAVNRWPTAEETLRLLRPDIYVKGQEFENLDDKTGKLQKEYEIIKELGAEIRFTQELVFSSTRLLNQFHPQITQIDTDKKPRLDENRELVSNNLRESVKKDERTYKIIGAAMDVHKELGAGFLEAVYQEALNMEFESRMIPYKEQPFVEIYYKERPLEKKYQPDFICFNDVIVEIKALDHLSGIEESQVINYLKAAEMKVGLLINFGCKSLDYKRFVN